MLWVWKNLCLIFVVSDLSRDQRAVRDMTGSTSTSWRTSSSGVGPRCWPALISMALSDDQGRYIAAPYKGIVTELV